MQKTKPPVRKQNGRKCRENKIWHFIHALQKFVEIFLRLILDLCSTGDNLVGCPANDKGISQSFCDYHFNPLSFFSFLNPIISRPIT